MVKKMLAVGLAALTAVVILFGVVAYSYLKPAEAASGPIETSAITQTAAGPRLTPSTRRRPRRAS